MCKCNPSIRTPWCGRGQCNPEAPAGTRDAAPTDTLAQATTPAEQAEVDYGENLIFRLVGSKVLRFGANASGEIYLATIKDGKRDEIVIGKDENGDICLFEVGHDEVPAA